MSSRNNRANPLENLVLIILALICVSISFIQTARGYDELAGPVFNWAFSIVISLFILLLNFRFREHLRKGITILGILAFYLIVTSFSFAGNFNAFYSQFMKKELYENEIKEFQAELEGIQQRAVTALNNSTNSETLRAEILPLKRALVAQIKNPGNPGMGQKAKSLLSELETKLGTTITLLQGRSNAETAELMGEQVEQLLDDKLQALTGDTDQLVVRINTMADSLKPEITSTLKSDRALLDNGKPLLTAISKTHNTIGELADNTLPDAAFSYTPIQSKNAQVGKISHSFQSAFRGDNPQATWIAGVASLAVDLLVPLYIFITVRRQEDDEDEDDDHNSGQYYERKAFGGIRRIGPKVAN